MYSFRQRGPAKGGKGSSAAAAEQDGGAGTGTGAGPGPGGGAEVEAVLEEPPKWGLLVEVGGGGG